MEVLLFLLALCLIVHLISKIDVGEESTPKQKKDYHDYRYLFTRKGVFLSLLLSLHTKPIKIMIMKKLFILLVLLCSVAVSNAQEKETEKSQSKAILFEQGIGSLIKKDFYDLPKVCGVENQVLILTDILTGTKIGCLRMETKPFSSSNETYVGTLDFEELDAAIKSLSYIKETILPTTPDVYSEIVFKSKDGVKLGTYFNQKTRKWVVFIYTKSYTSRSAKYFDETELSEMIEIMKTAKSKIQELTK